MSEDPSGDELADAVDEAVEPARHDAIMRMWHAMAMTHVESVRPPRDDDDPIKRLYDQQPPDEEPPT